MPVALSGPALLTVRVKVIVPPTLGVGLSTVMVSDRSAEAGGGMLSSYAPMSQVGVPSPLPSNGRATPRWSAAGHPVLVPASSAGLPEVRAWVSVWPPLFCRGPSNGSVLLRSPTPDNPQVFALSRLLPADTMVVLQFPPALLFATMAFFRTTVPIVLYMPPPSAAAFPV